MDGFFVLFFCFYVFLFRIQWFRFVFSDMREISFLFFFHLLLFFFIVLCIDRVAFKRCNDEKNAKIMAPHSTLHSIVFIVSFLRLILRFVSFSQTTRKKKKSKMKTIALRRENAKQEYFFLLVVWICLVYSHFSSICAGNLWFAQKKKKIYHVIHFYLLHLLCVSFLFNFSMNAEINKKRKIFGKT